MILLEHFEKLPKENVYPHKHIHLRRAFQRSRISGSVIECGVSTGATIRTIADEARPSQVVGFDSFLGLPEEWRIGETPDKIREVGTYSTNGVLPRVPENVVLIPGWFEDTLPKWGKAQEVPIRYIHIDSDLYSACQTILRSLNDLIVRGTVIVFDELVAWQHSLYPNWRDGEWKALQEWIEEYGREVAPFGRTLQVQASVIVRT